MNIQGIKGRKGEPLPDLCAPMKRRMRVFYMIFSVFSSIYAIFTMEDWAQDVDVRLHQPNSEAAKARPVTDMDYVWIIGVGVLFLLVLAATVVCRYVLREGRLTHILVAASVLFWVLDIVHPFLLTYTKEPYVKEGTWAFFIPLQMLVHAVPGAFFGFALTSWALLLLYCLEGLWHHMRGGSLQEGSPAKNKGGYFYG